MIKHIPASSPSPRTLSQAQRRAETDSRIEAVKRAKAPVLGARSLEPKRQAPVGAIITAVVVVLVALICGAVALWGFPKVIVGMAVGTALFLGVSIFAIRGAKVEPEDWNGLVESGERPHYEN